MTVTTATSAVPVEIPPGTIVPWLGGATALPPPPGWLFCDGSAVSRTTYAALFAAISTTYGAGNGTTTFTLPGGSTSFLVGKSAAGRGGVGQSSHAHNMTTRVTANLAGAAAHLHAVNAASIDATNWDHEHVPGVYNTNGETNAFNAYSGTANLLAIDHVHSIGIGNFVGSGNHTHNANSGSTGSESAHTHAVVVSNVNAAVSEANMPPYMLIWHLIKT